MKIKQLFDRLFRRPVIATYLPRHDKKYTRGDRYVVSAYKQSLKQNIDSISHKDHAYTIPDNSVRGVLTAISKNLYFEPVENLGKKILTLWDRYKDRELVIDLLDIAYSIESPWRHDHKRLVFFLDLTNPHTFAKISFSDLHGMTQQEEKNMMYKLKNLSYNDYLHTGWWRAIRLEALQRGNYECCICGATSDLQVHHTQYFVGSENKCMSDLVVLCKNCHMKQHNLD